MLGRVLHQRPREMIGSRPKPSSALGRFARTTCHASDSTACVGSAAYRRGLVAFNSLQYFGKEASEFTPLGN